MTFPALGGNRFEVGPSPAADGLAGRVAELERRLDALADSHIWKSYTPTWTASTTDPAIGNGTFTGRYLWVGRRVVVELYMVAGSTTTFGAGTWQIGLPVDFKDDIGGSSQVIGFGLCDDDSTGTYYDQKFVRGGSASSVAGRPHNATTHLGSANPFTWAQSDSLWGSLAYEAAADRGI